MQRPRLLAPSRTPMWRFISRLRTPSKAVPALVLADGDPDPLGGRGHVDVVDPVFPPQSLDDGVDDRGTGADRTRLARSLHAERIGLAGDVVGLELERGTVGGPRQRIVHV